MRWGFIGASNIAERVIPSLRKIPGQTLVGVYSGSLDRARDFAATQALPISSTDFHTFLEEGRFDAVYISSTNEKHCAQAIAALEHGCHVMCEKPLAMTHGEAHRMVAAARQRGRVLATNHHLRAAGAHRRMREIMASGELGTIHGLQVSHAVQLPPHLQGWRLDQAQAGGGVILDILVHNADLLRFLLGTEPQRIATFAQHNGLGRASVEDGAMSTVEFEHGVLAQMHQSFVAEHALTRLHVLGTRGNLYATGSLSQAGSATLTQRDGRGERDIPIDEVDLYEVGFTAFVDACAGRGQPLSSGADGAKALAVALAALASARSGSAERIDLTSL